MRLAVFLALLVLLAAVVVAVLETIAVALVSVLPVLLVLEVAFAAVPWPLPARFGHARTFSPVVFVPAGRDALQPAWQAGLLDCWTAFYGVDYGR